MALLKCVDCGKDVSDKASACPHCGCPIECSIEATATDEEDTAEENFEEKSEEYPSVTDYAEAESKENATFYPNGFGQTVYYTPQKKPSSGKTKKIIIAVAAAVVALIVAAVAVVCIAFGVFKNRKAASQEAVSAETTVAVETTETTEAEIDDGIRYITDCSVTYDKSVKSHNVTFGITNSKKEFVTAKEGKAKIKIVNLAGETVFDEEIVFSSENFKSGENAEDAPVQVMCLLNIKDTQLKKGTSAQGTVTLSVVADGVAFLEKELEISDLPFEKVTTTAHVHDYDYYVETEATCGEDGLAVYTCDCGDEYTKTLPKTSEHSFSAADCENPSECVFCGTVRQQAKGHRYNASDICFNCGAESPERIEVLSNCYLSLPANNMEVTYNGAYVTLTEMDYEFGYWSDGRINVTIYFSGTKTYDVYGDSKSKEFRVEWKLYDPMGNVCADGTLHTPSLATGESFYNETTTIFYLETPGIYNLVILNYA